MAFTYGLESGPAVVAKFLAKLTLPTKHSRIPLHTPTVRASKNLIPLKAITKAFSRMPKKLAAHRDGWTWEVLRDAAQRPSTAVLLQKFTEQFSTGALIAFLLSYLASALIYPFHKLLM